jgi:hypothetical protein
MTSPVRGVIAPQGLIRWVSALLMAGVVVVGQAALPERLTDPDDGALDLSRHLLEHSGVLPMPVIVTEPALGFGGGAAAVYFDDTLASKNAGHRAGDRLAPPNITALGGFEPPRGSRRLFCLSQATMADSSCWR